MDDERGIDPQIAQFMVHPPAIPSLSAKLARFFNLGEKLAADSL
jgi:hypothetical protein